MKHHRLRLLILSLLGLSALSVLVWRMCDLTIWNRQFLQHQGNARSLRTINIPAYRGMITDRHGSPLAVSAPVMSAWVNPKVFNPSKQQLDALANLLHLPSKKLSQQINATQGREFVYLKRQLAPGQAKKMEMLEIPGLNFQEEFKRYYPEGESIAPVLGFTNVDDNGIEGLELAYQQWLMGVPGKRRVIKDRVGRIIESLDLVESPRPGHTLTLSIDKRIQYFAYHELKNTLAEYHAKSGTIVVLEASTGEVLAIANAPSFNPNARQRYTHDHYRNRALTDLFEPGSVIKPLSIASALNTGQFTPDTLIDTNPSWMVVDGQTIRDMHNYGLLDVKSILQRSSNVGVSKMTLASPVSQLVGDLKNCGVGTRTGSGFPGESGGSIVSANNANRFVHATLSFGYGLSMTALQLARSYLVFANEGKLLPISLLHGQEQESAIQVFSPEVSRQVLDMLDFVVNSAKGTGKRAKVPGYRVAGKTGTARIAGTNGYEKDRHIASFVGIAPVSNPRLIVAVVIHEPTKGSYYGGIVAAPLFSKVMDNALRILNIPPDDAAV